MEGGAGSGPGGPSALWWLSVSASVERAVAGALVGGVAIVLVLVWRARHRPATPLPPLSPRAEWRALAVVLACAAIVRLACYDAAWQPRWYFSQSTTLYAARMLADGSLWREWLRWLGLTQIAFPHESAVFFPVSIGVQALTGPSDTVPLVVGALWGLLTVLLAWACGRAITSPEMGVVFAAFVAGSPIEVTWSRIGSLPIASAAQVLLVVWLAHRAGRRGGVVLALLAGLVAWTSVYHHYNARVAIPLGALALVVGLVQGRRGFGRSLLTAGVFAAGFAAALVAVQRAGGQGLWPAYSGYVGNRGEGTLASALASALESVVREGRTAIDVYFWNRRTGRVLDYWKLRGDAASGTAATAGVAAGA